MSELTLTVGHDKWAILINTPDGIVRAEIWLRGNVEAEEDLARRIVACVNYCKGVETSDMEMSSGLVDIRHMTRNDHEQCIRERDEAQHERDRALEKVDLVEYWKDVALRERDEARALVKDMDRMLEFLGYYLQDHTVINHDTIRGLRARAAIHV